MKLSLKDYKLQFKHTFRVAGADDRDSVDIEVLELKTNGTIGYGEASPSKFWGENIDQVKEIADKIDLKNHENPLVYELILKEIRETLNLPKSLLAAVDMALFDCIGKKMQIPVQRFFGFEKNEIPKTSFTIGYAELDVIEKKVKEAKQYPILKIKLGTSYDIEIVEKVRSLTDKILRVDANEGWLKEEAVEKINWLQTQNVELVEQPLPHDKIEDNLWIKERVNIPIIADESVKNSADIDKISDFFDGINIKLMKCGGILEAIKMVRNAKQKQLKVMIGCMTESSLGISAAVNLLTLVDYADLDSHLLITNDPFVGIQLENGQISVSKNPGLGVKPKGIYFNEN